ncbi:MAG: NAD-binding protein [Phycisphaerales bacterium]
MRSDHRGYGPIGRACTADGGGSGVAYAVVEMNAGRCGARRRGVPMMYGDVTNTEVLENAGIDTADAVVLTMPDHGAMLPSGPVRRLRPDIRIGVRVTLEQTGEDARRKPGRTT